MELYTVLAIVGAMFTLLGEFMTKLINTLQAFVL